VQPSIRRRDRRRQGGAAVASMVLLVIALFAAPGPAAAEPYYFSLSAPANNTAITFDSSFSWGGSNLATEYFVEIRQRPRGPGESLSPWETIAVGNSTSWKPAWSPDTLDFMAGREIEWRVRACQPSEPDPTKRCRYNNTTGFGEPTPFVAKVPLFPAQLSSPASGEVTGPLPTFQWLGNSSKGTGGLTVTFRLKVNGNLVACEQPSTQMACTPKTALPTGTHQWWVEQCVYVGGMNVCGPLPQFTKNTAPNQRIHSITIGTRSSGRTGG
jgi:hypothetical protein